MNRRSREGRTILEVLVTLLLLLLVFTVSVDTFRSQVEVARWTMSIVEGLEAARTSRWVVGTEVRAGQPVRDWAVGDDGVVRIRAFRATGVACGPPGPDGAVPVRYRGVRAPDPARDSVLLLGFDGRWRAAALTESDSGEQVVCPELHAGEEGAWRVSEELGGWVAARVFESGSYHMANRALRYRRGGEGRQPLVGETFGDGSLFLRDGRVLEVRVEIEGREPHVRDPAWAREWRIHPPEG